MKAQLSAARNIGAHKFSHPIAPTRKSSIKVHCAKNGATFEPYSAEVAARMADLGIDESKTGLRYLSNEARVSKPTLILYGQKAQIKCLLTL